MITAFGGVRENQRLNAIPRPFGVSMGQKQACYSKLEETVKVRTESPRGEVP